MSKYRKAHYEDIAKILREAYELADNYPATQSAGAISILATLQAQVSDLFMQDNNRFDLIRFNHAINK